MSGYMIVKENAGHIDSRRQVVVAGFEFRSAGAAAAAMRDARTNEPNDFFGLPWEYRIEPGGAPAWWLNR